MLGDDSSTDDGGGGDEQPQPQVSGLVADVLAKHRQEEGGLDGAFIGESRALVFGWRLLACVGWSVCACLRHVDIRLVGEVLPSTPTASNSRVWDRLAQRLTLPMLNTTAYAL